MLIRIVAVLGFVFCFFAVTQLAEARAGANCQGTMRSVMIGNTGAPLFTPIWAPVSHTCCCSCPPVEGQGTGTCVEIMVNAPVNGIQAMQCMCFYLAGTNPVLVVFDLDPQSGAPMCDSVARRIVASPTSSGQLVQQFCAGPCATGTCLPVIEFWWTNDGAQYKDETCECVG